MQVERDQRLLRHLPSTEEAFVTVVKHQIQQLVRRATRHFTLRRRREEGTSPRAIDTSANAIRPADAILQRQRDKGIGPVVVVHVQPHSAFHIAPLEAMPPSSPLWPLVAAQRSAAMYDPKRMVLDRKKLGRPGEALTSHPPTVHHGQRRKRYSVTGV